MKRTENQILVIFGASGDLTKRKLIPALYELYIQKLLPERFAVLGASRSLLSDDEFRNLVNEFLPDEPKVQKFKKLLFYQAVLTEKKSDFVPLKNRLAEISAGLSINGNYVFCHNRFCFLFEFFEIPFFFL